MRISSVQFHTDCNEPSINADAILAQYETAIHNKAELVVFPELALTGPDAGTLLLRKDYLDYCSSELKRIAKNTKETAIIIGAPLPDQEGRIYNCLIFAVNGEIQGCHQQLLLPFDTASRDRRYFSPGSEISTIDFAGEKIGLLCGSDSCALPGWAENIRYRIDPVDIMVQQGATLLINCSAFPYRLGKESEKRAIGTYHSAKNNLPFLHCGYTGVHKGEIYAGASYFLSRQGEEQHLPPFSTGILEIDTNTLENGNIPVAEGPKQLQHALIYGIQEVYNQGSWKKTIVVNRENAESALCLTLAQQALDNTPIEYLSPKKATHSDKQLLIESISRTEYFLHGSKPGFAPLADLSCSELISLLSLYPEIQEKFSYEGTDDQAINMILDNQLSIDQMISQGYPPEELDSLLNKCYTSAKQSLSSQSKLFFHDNSTMPLPPKNNF